MVFVSFENISRMHGDVTTVFEQGGIFIVPHLLRHGASVYTLSIEGPPPCSRLLRLRSHSNPDPFLKGDNYEIAKKKNMNEIEYQYLRNTLKK